MRNTRRQFRPVYLGLGPKSEPGGPTCSDIHGGIHVGVHHSAGCADKALAGTAAEAMTSAACLACAVGIDEFNRNTRPLRFVLKEQLELTEAPAGNHSIGVLVPHSHSISEATKPFQAESARRVPFGLFDQSFGENVVFVTDPPLLSPRKPFQQAPSTPPASRLQTSADTSALLLERTSYFAWVKRPGARRCRVGQTQVHPDNPTAWSRGAGKLDGDVKKPVFSLVDEGSGLGHLHGRSQPVFLVARELERHFASAIHGGKGRHRPFHPECARVVINRPALKSPRLSPAPADRLGGTHHASHRSHREIGGKPELVTQPVVRSMVKLERGSAPFGLTQRQVHTGSISLRGLVKVRPKLVSQNDLTTYGYHRTYIPTYAVPVKKPAKAGGIQLPEVRQ